MMATLTASISMYALLAAVSLVVVALLSMKRQLTYWKRRGVYALPSRLPFGNAAALVFQKKFIGFEFLDFYNLLKSKGLRYGGYYFFTKPIFIPTDLDLIKRMMTTDFAHFMDHINYIDEETEPLTGHLFSLKGQKWRQLRSKLSPTFSSAKLKMMFQTLANCTKGLTVAVDAIVQKNEALDIKDISARFTTDVIGSCAFGLECNSLRDPDSEFRKMAKKFFSTSLWDSAVRLMTMVCPEVIAYTKIRTVNKELNDFFLNVVTQTVNLREKHNVTRKDFMQLLIQLKNDETTEISGSITFNELAAQCFIFFLAGFETTSNTSTFLLYELAQNQEIQTKLRDEINTVLAKYSGSITYDGIMEMTYMDKCVQEVLRKYPAVPIHGRECTETYKVPDSDLTLEKGSFVFIPVLGIQRDPEYYPDPDKFDPERFSEENKTKRHLSTWTAFGDGPRTCIGMRFGLIQTKVGLTALLRDFRFTLNFRTETPLVLDPRMPLTLTARNGVWLNADRVT